jgi:uncharacterized protein
MRDIVKSDVMSACLADNRLYLIVLPTEACNLRCVYCYERFEMGRMTDPVLRGLKNLLTRRADDLIDLKISWFGGEPLLVRDIMEDVHQHVDTLLDGKPGVRFQGAMTTNAYMLSENVFRELLDMNIREYQITLDGPPEWHDRRRRLPNGRGTFDRIWRNLTALRKIPGQFKILIRIHVDEDNFETIPAFLERCREVFSGDARFQIFIRPLSRFGGPNDRKLCTLKDGMEDARITSLRKLVTSKGLAQYSECDMDVPCYAAWANSFIIRADGRINKCSIVMEHPGNQVGRLKEDGTVELDKPRMLAWMRGLRSQEQDILKCPMTGFQDPRAN